MSTNILRASQIGDEAQLKQIWKLCFHDDDHFIDCFFSEMYSPGMAAIMETDGIISSAIFTLHGATANINGSQPLSCPYVYSLGTHPDYRGRGHGAKVIAFSGKRAYDDGHDFVCFLPASDSLYAWYESVLGTETHFWAREKVISYAGTSGGSVNGISSAEYGELREQLLEGMPHVSFSQQLLSWQSRLCDFSGGGMFRLTIGGERGCAIAETGDNGLFIKELIFRGKATDSAASLLIGELGHASALVRTPAFVGDGGIRRFSVVIPAPDGRAFPQDRNAYWGLAFD